MARQLLWLGSMRRAQNQAARLQLGIGCLLGSLAVTACAGNDETVLVRPNDGMADGPVAAPTLVPGDGRIDFVSNVPAAAGAERGAVDGAGGGSAQPPPAGNGDDLDGGAERAITEADILQLAGDRLYALSRYSGLSIVDVSDPAALRLLGTYRSAAEPFEMYVEDGIVFAMFNSWYSYECDAATEVCSWQTTSRMQAIDARDPENIQLLADYSVPGSISDSRRVGDVLYLATHESGACWGCQTQPNATLTSFDVADASNFVQVDQLRLLSPANTYTGERSISVTEQRIYISGWEWRDNQPTQAGSIQVVDISDPSGALVQGSRFDIAGQIQSRWQMDEYDGVLRVISQPGGWGGSTPPVLEMFRVNSASDLQPAGRLSIRLPRPNEILQSVRFDGTRAYAITAERRDPLFTFDLTDPDLPLQLGELEMPGWVYHMEPRGNRVYALGFDPDNPDGSLNVSLFDVTTLAAPTLLSRIGFGGDWGSFAEDQNRIHKAFSILEDTGLILVPYSGGAYAEATCEYDYSSGIQLVDFTDTTLVRRGVAPQVGSARRALLHRERLLGIGDNTVQTFDISNRDAPVAEDRLDVARNISTVRVMGDHLMRFGSDWATNQTTLDMVPLDRAGAAQPQAEIDLSALYGADTWSCNGSASWSGQVFTRGDYAYVPRYTYAASSAGGYEQRLTFFIIDLSDRSVPRAVGSFALEPAGSGSYFSGIIQTDNTLLVGRSTGYFRYDDAEGRITERPLYQYDVIDLSNAGAPRVATRFEVPELIAGGGWGYFIGGCTMDMAWGWGGGYYGRYSLGGSVALTHGDLVVSQHAQPTSEGDGAVKYYLDRIDVSDPENPQILPSVNIPGTVVHFNAQTAELVTVDYERSVEPGTGYGDCNRGAYGTYDAATGSCEVFRRTLNSLVLEGEQAVRRSRLLLDLIRRTGQVAVSDRRIFYTTLAFPPPVAGPDTSISGGSSNVDTDPTTLPVTPVSLETLSLSDGQLTRLPSLELRREYNLGWYSGQLFARDERVFEIHDNTLIAVDTADASAPTRLTHEIPGWSCQSLEVAGDGGVLRRRAARGGGHRPRRVEADWVGPMSSGAIVARDRRRQTWWKERRSHE